MRFEGNSRGMSRNDYQQFTDFLGLSHSRCSRNTPVVTAEACAIGKDPIGMVYGVEQNFVSIYDPEMALEVGTVFEELNKPFYPTGCNQKHKEGCL